MQSTAEVFSGRGKRGGGVLALNKAVVTVYKLAGFAILTVILFGLVSYLGVNLYYSVSSDWIVPTVISPTDERVLRLESLASQETAAKDNLSTRRLELEAQRRSARRTIEVERAFQEAFGAAVSTNLGDRQTELSRLQTLKGSYAGARSSIAESRDAYAGMSKEALEDQYRAHVIDKQTMLEGSYELAQIAGANLTLDDKSVEIDTRLAALRREISSLEASRSVVAGSPPTGASVSYEVLHMQREYAQSVLASSRAADDLDALDKSIAALDQGMAEHDRLIDRIRHSPLVLAADKSMTMAFVPYDGRQRAKVGTSVYGCRLGLLWCARVGQVVELADGEAIGKHPLHNRDLRGVTVRLRLDDPKWAEEPVLHLGRKPLFL